MTKFMIVALLTVSPAVAQTVEPSPKPPLTDRERIQADRARAAAEERNGSAARPWDRDANGKRPWQKPVTGLDGLPKP